MARRSGKPKPTKRQKPWRLKEVLELLGISQGELARRTKVTPGEVSAWCRGPYYPSWRTALRIAEALDVPLDVLAGRVDPPAWARSRTQVNG